ncbi:hypothetical protein MATL_G00218000 [Megalops atlanticus]|uniref:Fibronectin type-III domain-containing protein n=1 Tax=Megalops atlanticus TaxID=7932 RepID=A0A9D3SY36_MEGAT|nr:hypothetical protein MATL_G00218000 [Megalops atlanticus]
MAWLSACLFLLSAGLLQQAVGVGVTCLWEKYFHIGHNVSGACGMSKHRPPGCGSQSLRLTADGKPLLAYHHSNDTAHFAIPAPAKAALHLRCELTCAGLKSHSYCDITLQGGYPPHPPSRPECHIRHGDRDIQCSWDPGRWALLPTNYTLHWKQYAEECSPAGVVSGTNTSATVPYTDFCEENMTVWVVAQNGLGSVQSENADFHTVDIVKPHAPVITNHSVQPLEIFILWNLVYDELVGFCEVQYRTQEEGVWREGDDVAQDNFLLQNPQPFSVYEFRVRCSCEGGGVRSAWSNVYRALSSEAAPDGKMDVWSDCGMSDGQSECALVWKELPRSVARGKVLGYLLTVEHNTGNVTVMNFSTEEVGPREGVPGAANQSEICSGRCSRLPFSLQGVKGVNVMAYTSQGRTDPAPLALPKAGPEVPLAVSVTVAVEGRSLNVSWAPPTSLTQDVEYVVQCKEAGLHQTRGFDWIKVNGTQRSVILAGNYRNYTPYNLSLFGIFGNCRCLLGSVIVYTVQGVPPKVANLEVSEIKSSGVSLTWDHIPLAQRRGVILRYHLGQGNYTEYNVSGHRNSLLLLDLQPGQRYQFWIRAETAAGQGPRTYISFVTMMTYDYVPYTIVALLATFALGLLLVFLYRSLKRLQHCLGLTWCCEKVPDPKNSGLLRQIQYTGSWPGFFSLAEHSQKLSYVEVVEIQAQERDSFLETTPDPDGQTDGWDNEGQIQTEEEEEEEEKESKEEWREAGERSGSELGGEREDYSQMIDSEGREEGMSWSPTETQEIFSGYERHFMPSPLEV